MWSGVAKGLMADREYGLKQRELDIQQQQVSGRGEDVMDKARLAAERILQQREAAQLRADTQKDIAEEQNKVARERMGLTARGQDFTREVGLEGVEARLKGLEARSADIALQEKGKTERNQATISQRDRALNALNDFRAGKLFIDKMRIDDLKELAAEANRIANDRGEDYSRQVDASVLLDNISAELKRKELEEQGYSDEGRRVLEKFLQDNPSYSFRIKSGVPKEAEEMYSSIGRSPSLLKNYLGTLIRYDSPRNAPPLVYPQPGMRPAPAVAPASAPQGGLVAATAQPPPAPAPQAILVPDTTAVQTIQDANKNDIPDADEENYTEALTFISRYEAAKRKADKTRTRNPSVESRRGDYEKAKKWVSVYLSKYNDQLKRQSGLKK